MSYRLQVHSKLWEKRLNNLRTQDTGSSVLGMEKDRWGKKETESVCPHIKGVAAGSPFPTKTAGARGATYSRSSSTHGQWP